MSWIDPEEMAQEITEQHGLDLFVSMISINPTAQGRWYKWAIARDGIVLQVSEEHFATQEEAMRRGVLSLCELQVVLVEAKRRHAIKLESAIAAPPRLEQSWPVEVHYHEFDGSDLVQP